MPQQSAKPQHTIVFDLDGTLVDTAPDLIAALNALFAREGIEQLPFMQARESLAAARARSSSGGSRRKAER
jgi:phosphoglycolate phosphatase-like HAD superfamily hydrolase